VVIESNQFLLDVVCITKGGEDDFTSGAVLLLGRPPFDNKYS